MSSSSRWKDSRPRSPGKKSLHPSYKEDDFVGDPALLFEPQVPSKYNNITTATRGYKVNMQRDKLHSLSRTTKAKDDSPAIIPRDNTLKSRLSAINTQKEKQNKKDKQRVVALSRERLTREAKEKKGTTKKKKKQQRQGSNKTNRKKGKKRISNSKPGTFLLCDSDDSTFSSMEEMCNKHSSDDSKSGLYKEKGKKHSSKSEQAMSLSSESDNSNFTLLETFDITDGLKDKDSDAIMDDYSARESTSGSHSSNLQSECSTQHSSLYIVPTVSLGKSKGTSKSTPTKKTNRSGGTGKDRTSSSKKGFTRDNDDDSNATNKRQGDPNNNDNNKNKKSKIDSFSNIHGLIIELVGTKLRLPFHSWLSNLCNFEVDVPNISGKNDFLLYSSENYCNRLASVTQIELGYKYELHDPNGNDPMALTTWIASEYNDCVSWLLQCRKAIEVPADPKFKWPTKTLNMATDWIIYHKDTENDRINLHVFASPDENKFIIWGNTQECKPDNARIKESDGWFISTSMIPSVKIPVSDFIISFHNYYGGNVLYQWNNQESYVSKAHPFYSLISKPSFSQYRDPSVPDGMSSVTTSSVSEMSNHTNNSRFSYHLSPRGQYASKKNSFSPKVGATIQTKSSSSRSLINKQHQKLNNLKNMNIEKQSGQTEKTLFLKINIETLNRFNFNQMLFRKDIKSSKSSNDSAQTKTQSSKKSAPTKTQSTRDKFKFLLGALLTQDSLENEDDIYKFGDTLFKRQSFQPWKEDGTLNNFDVVKEVLFNIRQMILQQVGLKYILKQSHNSKNWNKTKKHVVPTCDYALYSNKYYAYKWKCISGTESDITLDAILDKSYFKIKYPGIFPSANSAERVNNTNKATHTITSETNNNKCEKTPVMLNETDTNNNNSEKTPVMLNDTDTFNHTTANSNFIAKMNYLVDSAPMDNGAKNLYKMMIRNEFIETQKIHKHGVEAAKDGGKTENDDIVVMSDGVSDMEGYGSDRNSESVKDGIFTEGEEITVTGDETVVRKGGGETDEVTDNGSQRALGKSLREGENMSLEGDGSIVADSVCEGDEMNVEGNNSPVGDSIADGEGISVGGDGTAVAESSGATEDITVSEDNDNMEGILRDKQLMPPPPPRTNNSSNTQMELLGNQLTESSVHEGVRTNFQIFISKYKHFEHVIEPVDYKKFVEWFDQSKVIDNHLNLFLSVMKEYSEKSDNELDERGPKVEQTVEKQYNEAIVHSPTYKKICECIYGARKQIYFEATQNVMLHYDFDKASNMLSSDTDIYQNLLAEIDKEMERASYIMLYLRRYFPIFRLSADQILEGISIQHPFPTDDKKTDESKWWNGHSMVDIKEKEKCDIKNPTLKDLIKLYNDNKTIPSLCLLFYISIMFKSHSLLNKSNNPLPNGIRTSFIKEKDVHEQNGTGQRRSERIRGKNHSNV